MDPLADTRARATVYRHLNYTWTLLGLQISDALLCLAPAGAWVALVLASDADVPAWPALSLAAGGLVLGCSVQLRRPPGALERRLGRLVQPRILRASLPPRRRLVAAGRVG